jgi:hypothetical protein
MAVPPSRGKTRVSAVFVALIRAMPPERLTLQRLLAPLGERGPLFLCILVTVPVLLWVSIPGLSIPWGAVMALHGMSLLTHRTPWLQDRLLLRRLAGEASLVVLERGVRLPSTEARRSCAFATRVCADVGCPVWLGGLPHRCAR